MSCNVTVAAISRPPARANGRASSRPKPAIRSRFPISRSACQSIAWLLATTGLPRRARAARSRSATRSAVQEMKRRSADGVADLRTCRHDRCRRHGGHGVVLVEVEAGDVENLQALGCEMGRDRLVDGRRVGCQHRDPARAQELERRERRARSGWCRARPGRASADQPRDLRRRRSPRCPTCSRRPSRRADCRAGCRRAARVMSPAIARRLSIVTGLAFSIRLVKISTPRGAMRRRSASLLTSVARATSPIRPLAPTGSSGAVERHHLRGRSDG